MSVTDPSVLAPDSARAAALLAPFPLLGTAPLDEARAGFPAMMAMVDLPGPEMGRVWDDVVVAEDAELPVRVYEPVDVGPDVLVWAHGGGWVGGDLDAPDDPLVRRLAKETGCTIVAVDYRLAPEHPFPTPLDDVIAAVLAARDVVERGGGDTTGRIGVGGMSAGGNLAAGAAIALRDRGFELDLQVLVVAVLCDHRRVDDLQPSTGDFTGVVECLRWEWEQYCPGEGPVSVLAEPLAADRLEGLAPAVVLTAEHDLLTHEGRAYAERLRAAGVPVDFHEVPGALHGVLSFSRMGPQTDEEIARLARMMARRWRDPVPTVAEERDR